MKRPLGICVAWFPGPSWSRRPWRGAAWASGRLSPTVHKNPMNVCHGPRRCRWRPRGSIGASCEPGGDPVIFFLVRAPDAVELELIRTHPTGANESRYVRWIMGGRLGHIWGVVGARDSMVIVWLYNIFQVYRPAMRSIPKLKVLHRVVDVFVSFGRQLLTINFFHRRDRGR